VPQLKHTAPLTHRHPPPLPPRTTSAQGIGYFLDNAPTPATFKSSIQDLEAAKLAVGYAIGNLTDYLTSAGSDLNKLIAAVPIVAGAHGNITDMQTKWTLYQSALNAMPGAE
jgi:hypothetical protein